MDPRYVWTVEHRNCSFLVEYFPALEGKQVCVSIEIPGTEELREAWCGLDDVTAAMERLMRREPRPSSSDPNELKARG